MPFRPERKKFKCAFVLALMTIVISETRSGFAQQAVQQAAPQQGTVVGGATALPGNDPGFSGVPRAFQLSQDPFASINFEMCQTIANNARRPPTADLTNYDAKTAATQSIGTMLGTLAGSAGKATPQNYLQNSYDVLNGTALSCDSEIKVPKVGDRCESYRGANNKVDMKKLESDIMAVRNAKNNASCRELNAKKAADVTDCFSKAIENLKDALREVRKDFESNIEAMEKYVTDIEAAKEKEQQKIGTLGDKLKSLQDTMAQVKPVLDRINGGGSQGHNAGTLLGIKQRMDSHQIAVERYQHSLKRERVNYVYSCFLGPGAQGSKIRVCPDAKSDLMNPWDCIQSAYRDSVALQLSGGDTRVSPADKNKAERKAKMFEQRVRQIVSSLGGNPPSFGSFESFLKYYSSELKSYGPVGFQVLSELGMCHSEGFKKQKERLDDHSSDIGFEAATLKAGADSIAADMRGMVGELDTLMRDTGRQIFGRELNELLNSNACNTTANTTNTDNGAVAAVNFTPVELKLQYKCIQGLNENLMAVMNGTPPPGSKVPLEVPLQVPGLDGSPARCKGLRDCIAKASDLQAAAKSKYAQLDGNGTFQDPRCQQGCPGLKKFKKESNLQIRKNFRLAAEMFAKRVAIAKGQMESMKFALRGVKVSFPPTDVQKFDLDGFCAASDQQLCKMPADFGDQLGALAGLPNIDPNSLQTVKADTAAKEEKAAQDQVEAKAALHNLETMANTCKTEDKDRSAAKKVSSISRDLNSRLQKCTAAANKLKEREVQDFGSNLSDLSSALKEVCNSASSDPEECKPLESQILTAAAQCESIYEDRKEAKHSAVLRKCRDFANNDEVKFQNCVRDNSAPSSTKAK